MVRQWHVHTSAATGPTATRQAYAVLRAIQSREPPDGAPARPGSRRAGRAPPRARIGITPDRLFTRPDGSTLRAHHVHAAWATARTRASLPGAHLHDLRHASLKLAAPSGATLAEVMRRAGHSSSRTAMIYQHAAESRDAEVAARLGRLAVGTRVNRTGTQWARRGR